MKRKLRILVLMHKDLVPPETIEGLSEEEIAPWKTEYDVTATLENMGHEVRPLGVATDLGVIREALEQFKPHITFNLLEEFHGFAAYDQHVVSFLELMQQKYTGCNPRGLTLARDKALTKKILTYHRINVPKFHVFPLKRKVVRPKGLEFPLLVKSVTEEGSVGISQASIVRDDERLKERVDFVHRHFRTYAIAEEFIEGRELYVGLIGNQRLETLPIWELLFEKAPPDFPRIATAKVKWDYEYQKRLGVTTRAAEDLPPQLPAQLPRLCKRIYRTLNLSGYARMDLRLSESGEVYLLEANPNPQLGYGEDFAESAEAGGTSYEQLLQRIINLGMTYRPDGLA
jgi:D-alanine-D-alanine ligase